MKQARLLAFFLFLVLAFLTACAPQPTPPPATPIAAPSVEVKAPAPGVTAAAWKEEWRKTIEAAKRGGKVVVYSTLGGIVVPAVGRVIKDKFGLRVECVSGKGAEIATKLLAERRASLYLGDVYIGGATTTVTQLKPAGVLAPLEPALILPEVLDPQAWYGGGLRWVDPGHSNLAFVAMPITTLTVNTTMVKPDDIKSYKDLLNPKWRGKIVMNDPTLAGIGGRFFLVLGKYMMGFDYMRELAKQEPVIIRDQRLQVDWVARGKYPIAIATQTEVTIEFMRAGAPIAYIMPAEGTWLSSGSGTLGLISGAPCPNAAKTFINWLLTKEGQTVFSEIYGAPSARIDVSTEGMDPAKLRQPKVKYFIADREEILLAEPEVREAAKEIFGHLMK